MRFLDRPPEDPGWGHARGPGTEGVRLHYVRRGRGEAVVLLHGWPGFWYDWRRVVFPLSEGADVIAPDFRGFGDSDKPEGDARVLYAPDRLAADMLALLDHLGIARFVVVGHDTGAVIAQVLARGVPERVRALALFNTPHAAIGDKPQEPAAQREAWYHHFHALPWSHELVGYDRDTIELYLRHFYDHCNWMEYFNLASAQDVYSLYRDQNSLMQQSFSDRKRFFALMEQFVAPLRLRLIPQVCGQIEPGEVSILRAQDDKNYREDTGFGHLLLPGGGAEIVPG